MKRQKKKDPLIKIEAKTEKAVFRPKMLERWRWALALTVAIITFLVYLPALKNGFVNWDDNVYVYENVEIQTFDLRLFSWIPKVTIWHPLTMISLALDYALWGLNPAGFHLTNNILHALNTFLVFILVFQLVETAIVKKSPGQKAVAQLSDNTPLIVALVAALLFGLHPLHVESVAWVSERKDVLSAFFYLLSILVYLAYAAAINSRKNVYYGVCLSFFVLSLMSKPMAVSLPIVLLILDFYPLARFTSKNIKVLLSEKLPFLLLSLLASFVTLWVHHSRQMLASTEMAPIVARVFVAIRAYIFYLLKMILPVDLAPLYSFPTEINYFNIEYAGSFVLLLIITTVCFWSLKRSKSFLAIWLYYVVTLMPVIGILQGGLRAAADRNSYLPSLGPFLFAGLGIAYICEKYNEKKTQIAIIIATLLVSGLLASKTVKQIAIWHDSITLWTHQIKIFPHSSSVPYGNLGAAYLESGDVSKAIENSDIAIEIDPQYARAYINRSLAYDSLGDYEKAVKDYNAAIELDPGNAKAYYNRGNSYFKTGNYQSAIQDYNKAVELDPQYLMAYYNLGTAYNSIDNYQRAVKAFTKVIELDPGDTRAYTNRGSAYNSLGDYRAAIADFSMAVKIDPRSMPAYYNLGVAYSQIGDSEQSIANYKKAAALGLKEAQDYLRSHGK